ncbi:MAG: beta-lactamase family protein [Ruminococcaceae bacterium]|nr:beta-lactamase family protein [Oscillospiraceae bacterium]
MKKINLSILNENLEKRIQNDVDTNHILGATVMVRQEGEVLADRSWGYRDVEKKIPLGDNDLFRIASMTKPVTGVAAMILVDRGLLKVDDEIEKYIPEFSRLRKGKLDENGNIRVLGKLDNAPTVKNILTHTTLIDYGELFKAQMKAYTDEHRADLHKAVDFYSSLVVEMEPGVMNSYSGTVAFDVLGVMIERITGRGYSEFLRNEIFLPLGMKDTTFEPTESQWDRIVQMHDLKDGESVLSPTLPGCVFEDFPSSHPLGGAGLVSSVKDYDRFASMLLNGGVLDGNRILSEKAVETMATPPYPQLKNSSNRWGLSVRVIDTEDKILPVGCFGWSGAYGTHFWVDPVNKITAVYMKNSRHDGGGGCITAKNFERDVVASML